MRRLRSVFHTVATIAARPDRTCRRTSRSDARRPSAVPRGWGHPGWMTASARGAAILVELPLVLVLPLVATRLAPWYQDRRRRHIVAHGRPSLLGDALLCNGLITRLSGRSRRARGCGLAGWNGPYPGDPFAGVREPRRPRPHPPADAIALVEPFDG
jgi:hypothetical protein